MSKWGRKAKRPEGFDYVEPTLDVLEREIRDRYNEPHEGKRKAESSWPVHQINWQRRAPASAWVATAASRPGEEAP